MAMFQKPAIGLDISDHSIEAVFMVRRGDRLAVASYGRTTLPPGAVVDGYVERRDVASLALRKLLADKMTPPLPKGIDRVVFALPESQVYSHIFEVPRVADEAELGRSLAIEADGYFPYRHDEMVSGYAVIGQRPDRKDIYYAAVHKDTLKSYLDLFAASGLSLEAVENESASIARATLLPNEAEPVMFVDVGARVSNISVFDRSGIQFSEALETAGDAFTQALARALGITVEDADSLKRNQGLIGEFDLKAQKAMRDTADSLAKDVLAAREYYEAKSGRPISRIVMCGGSTLMPGLVEYVSGKLSSPSRTQRVEHADPWSGLELDPLLEKLNLRERGVLATTAVGLSMRGLGVRKFSDINLLSAGAQGHSAELPRPAGPRRIAPLRGGARHMPTWLKLAAAVAAVLTLAVGAWFASFRMRGAAPADTQAPQAASSAIPLEVTAEIGEATSADPRVLAVTDIEVEAELRVTVDRPGEETSGYAKGTILIINESGNGQTLVATTRLLSEGGVTFRLDSRVFVPARARVSAAMTADQSGAQGDVPVGRFTIPGLSVAVQKAIYGETSEPTRGGMTVSGAPFTEEDVASLRSMFESEAEETLKSAAAAKAGEGAILVADSFEIFEIRYLEAPVVGEPVGSFSAHAVVLARSSAIEIADAEILLRSALPEPAQGTKHAFRDIEASLGGDAAEGEIRLTAIADVLPEAL